MQYKYTYEHGEEGDVGEEKAEANKKPYRIFRAKQVLWEFFHIFSFTQPTK